MIVLVTGGDGYIGSHCVLELLNLGHDVIILDSHETGHNDTKKALGNSRFKGKILESIDGNLLDIDDVDRRIGDHRIDAVIHLAAYSQVAESMKDPDRYHRNNVIGTMNLLDLMRRRGIDKVVFSSSAAVYGEPIQIPIGEDHPLEPISPYGVSKVMAERMLADYDRDYGIRSVSLRYFNVIGASSSGLLGEWHDPETHLVPKILRTAIEDGQFELYGDDYPTRDGTCVRDYLNVEDLADAHILALDHLVKGGRTDCFNLGTDEGHTTREILDECMRITGKRIQTVIMGRRSGDPAVLIADSSKARKILGWEPRRSLSQSIETAYEWERKKRDLR